MTTEVIVIGAGVVGLSAALAAQSRGLSVRVVEREAPAAGASAGNAGAFAFTDIFPLASPKIIRQAPKWLLDPLGPLSVPPAYAAKIAPWMLKFWRASWPARVRAATEAQTALMNFSKAALEPALERDGLLHMLRKQGNLQVYEGEREFNASLDGWEARARHGIEFQHLKSPAEITEIQPGLGPRAGAGRLHLRRAGYPDLRRAGGAGAGNRLAAPPRLVAALLRAGLVLLWACLLLLLYFLLRLALVWFFLLL